MPHPAARYTAAPATLAEGWTLARLTPPSRLHGANGLRTGKDGRIYVAQVCGSQVSAVHPDTGDIETISPMGGGITGPDDLAFDDAGNLYCTEISTNKLSVLHPDGTTRVLHGNVPVANPVTVYQNRVIAGELRMDAQIREFDRSTGEARVILDNVPMPNAFEVGPDGKLYFPAQGMNEIWRVSLDGGPHEVVAKDLGVPDSVKFDAQGFIISTQVGSGQVLRIDPRTGAREVLADIAPGLDNCTLVGDRLFVSHITGSLHEVANGVARPVIDSGFQWPMGIGVDAGGNVHVADGMFAYSIAPGQPRQQVGTLFLGNYPGFLRGLAMESDGKWLVTTANGTAARWSPGTEPELLASGFDRLMGIASAPGGGAVFADYDTGRVMLAAGGTVSELASGLSKPMGVACDADGGVYVAESGKGRVVKLAGGVAEAVIDGLGEPQGIAIRGSKLYVLDTATKQVVASDLSGGNQSVIAAGLPVGAPVGVVAKPLGGVGDMCGPMTSCAGIAVGADGALYISADAEGSVIALRPGQ
jgi:sugar lactone lactonase YvrE